MIRDERQQKQGKTEDISKHRINANELVAENKVQKDIMTSTFALVCVFP